MSHFYSQKGQPCHFVACKSRPGETRATTIADARKLNLVPGVTTVLNVLRKPALEKWLVMQGVLAVLTAPPKPNEDLDAFVERVMVEEKQQDQESNIAKDRGTAIHAQLEIYFSGSLVVDANLWPWVQPAVEAIEKYGKVHATERVLVGDGYAGKVDLIQDRLYGFHIWDFKTCRKLPSKPYPEAVIQCAAYAKAMDNLFYETPESVRPGVTTGNVYISTTEQGQFKILDHGPWMPTYANAFLPLLTVWKYLNNI